MWAQIERVGCIAIMMVEIGALPLLALPHRIIRRDNRSNVRIRGQSNDRHISSRGPHSALKGDRHRGSRARNFSVSSLSFNRRRSGNTAATTPPTRGIILDNGSIAIAASLLTSRGAHSRVILNFAVSRRNASSDLNSACNGSTPCLPTASNKCCGGWKPGST